MTGIFEQVYYHYKNAIYNYLYRCTLNTHTAEELTQETFLRAFKYFGSFRGEASAKTWLFRIARNVYLDNREKADIEVDSHMLNQFITEPYDAVGSFHEQDMINGILSSLRDEERTIIVLRDLNGFTYKEIAEIMNYTEGQVKIGIFRARRKFRDAYLEGEKR